MEPKQKNQVKHKAADSSNQPKSHLNSGKPTVEMSFLDFPQIEYERDMRTEYKRKLLSNEPIQKGLPLKGFLQVLDIAHQADNEVNKPKAGSNRRRSHSVGEIKCKTKKKGKLRRKKKVPKIEIISFENFKHNPNINGISEEELLCKEEKTEKTKGENIIDDTEKQIRKSLKSDEIIRKDSMIIHMPS